ncbi:MAG TPA: SIS domain-containing protein [Exilispira sp.]|nr:SIS domain-containing protein [Exilispira sp.]
MCGVVSIIYEKENKKIGVEAVNLLKRLEYRGYDSTGASFIDQSQNIVVRKKVGAPSKVVEELQISQFGGQRFIGQVRWATFGAVTDKNSQPHLVNCYERLVGAHNGNIANTDTLKEYLKDEGHKVVSDNDGEILVHLIEHFYHNNKKQNNIKIDKEIIKKVPKLNEKDDTNLVLSFIDAIRKADTKANGSYAACIADPMLHGVFAIKSGSSLYAGIGKDDEGDFIVVSSDLTSVLSKTRLLIPLKEGEAIYFTEKDYFIFPLSGELNFVKPEAKRSKLNVKDTALSPRFHFYMEQEIYTSSQNINEILLYYFMSDERKPLYDYFENDEENSLSIYTQLIQVNTKKTDEEMGKSFLEIIDKDNFKKLFTQFLKERKVNGNFTFSGFISDEKQLLSDLYKINKNWENELIFLDNLILWKKQRKILKYLETLVNSIIELNEKNGNVFVIACGTSYHAALTGSYFFNNLTSIPLLVVNPGAFRSQYLSSLNEKDLIIVISQSGETKDLIDIIQDCKIKNKDITVVSIVNNENSRIPQELSDYFLPILCGPEIAVAATKSFINQLLILYIIASKINLKINKKDEQQLKKNILKIQDLIDETLSKCDKDITEVALKLFLKPSIHILGTSLTGISKEGALKIREVVLNHTEGYDSVEFKHGPNTILGKNTLFSISDIQQIMTDLIDFLRETYIKISKEKNFNEIVNNILKELSRIGLEKDQDLLDDNDNNSESIEKQILRDFMKKISIESYFSNYPLIFICPPDERDIRITIAQIHTHKIRGADVILIAEDNDELAKSIINPPENSKNYFSKFIKIPSCDDKNIFVFPASIVLQTLAFKMSVMKMKYLNSLKIDNHGVHPDAPKNVSKSITVD